MIIKEIDYPLDLMKAFKENRVVIFAGAGISMGEPACCPSFNSLSNLIASGTGLFRKDNESIDEFLGRVSDIGVDIKKEAAELLNASKYNKLHFILLSLFSSHDEIKIITTNFDMLFEKCAEKNSIKIPRLFSAPAMPLGRNFKGLAHIHGENTYYEHLVLNDQDFGEAYITEGWASRFLLDICKHYVTVFIGYSHNDTLMKYFSRAVPKRTSQARYILTDDNSISWSHLGLTPIFFAKGNFLQQEESLCELSNILRADYFNWEAMVKKILSENPSNCPEDNDRVEYILNDEKRVKIFTDNATKFDWFLWLQEKGYLDFLFAPKQKLNAVQDILCKWIVEQFSLTHSTELTIFLGEKLSVLHPSFCDSLQKYLFLRLNSIPGNILRLWLVILLKTGVFLERRSSNLFYLTEIAKSQNALPFVWGSINTNIRFASPFVRGHGSRFRIEIEPSHIANTKQDDFLNANLSDYQSFIYSCIHSIHNAYITRFLLEDEGAYFDSESWEISAIEEHKQNQHGRFRVQVTLLRDLLLKLDTYDHPVFLSWINILVKDSAPLLKRIAIYVMGQSTETAECKVKWLLESIFIHDTWLHHEVCASPPAWTTFY